MNAVTQPQSSIKNSSALFIGGKWQKPAGQRKLHVISPVTEQVVMTFPEASPADVDSAVAAARNAFDTGPWPRMSAQERGKALITKQPRARSKQLASSRCRWVKPLL